ncbi:hypothetical protein LOAG_19199 [Loa loa]|uniref:Uncharacterized protein n=1 Tax=Loa loa TaxID=7209 RepID=A0A1S0UDD7_LOALO|nr:hypothetical protein LOAG_19199 [Loa loa]EJD73378.1 hypothetical protein LOAG_19199 [Loa loa]
MVGRLPTTRISHNRLLRLDISKRNYESGRFKTIPGSNKRRLPKVHQQSHSNNKQQISRKLVATRTSKFDMRAFDRRVTLTWIRFGNTEQAYFGYHFGYWYRQLPIL